MIVVETDIALEVKLLKLASLAANDAEEPTTQTSQRRRETDERSTLGQQRCHATRYVVIRSIEQRVLP